MLCKIMANVDTEQKLVFLFILMLTALWTELGEFWVQFQFVKVHIWVPNNLQSHEGYLKPRNPVCTQYSFFSSWKIKESRSEEICVWKECVVCCVCVGGDWQWERSTEVKGEWWAGKWGKRPSSVAGTMDGFGSLITKSTEKVIDRLSRWMMWWATRHCIAFSFCCMNHQCQLCPS